MEAGRRKKREWGGLPSAFRMDVRVGTKPCARARVCASADICVSMRVLYGSMSGGAGCKSGGSIGQNVSRKAAKKASEAPSIDEAT
eukprot:6172973-Pleurochrysis_carterae.AAC.2